MPFKKKAQSVNKSPGSRNPFILKWSFRVGSSTVACPWELANILAVYSTVFEGKSLGPMFETRALYRKSCPLALILGAGNK